MIDEIVDSIKRAYKIEPLGVLVLLIGSSSMILILLVLIVLFMLSYP